MGSWRPVLDSCCHFYGDREQTLSLAHMQDKGTTPELHSSSDFVISKQTFPWSPMVYSCGWGWALAIVPLSPLPIPSSSRQPHPSSKPNLAVESNSNDSRTNATLIQASQIHWARLPQISCPEQTSNQDNPELGEHGILRRSGVLWIHIFIHWRGGNKDALYWILTFPFLKIGNQITPERAQRKQQESKIVKGWLRSCLSSGNALGLSCSIAFSLMEF